MRSILKLDKYIKNQTIREWTEALLFAGIVALIFRTWLFAPYNVPTGSMVHTIEIGDHIFANKHAYGFVIPFTDVKLFPEKVERGDIIVFPFPKDPSINFIKRVVAIGGDHIKVVGDDAWVNEKKVEGDHIYLNHDLKPNVLTLELTLKEGEIFVMGDNRRNSADSRKWGIVREETVLGRGSFIYWSHDPSKSLFEGYRFERIGKFLE